MRWQIYLYFFNIIYSEMTKLDEVILAKELGKEHIGRKLQNKK